MRCSDAHGLAVVTRVDLTGRWGHLLLRRGSADIVGHLDTRIIAGGVIGPDGKTAPAVIEARLQRLTMAKNKTNKESGVVGPPNTHS